MEIKKLTKNEYVGQKFTLRLIQQTLHKELLKKERECSP